MLGITGGGAFLDVKGILETILDTLHINQRLEIHAASHPLFEPGRYVELRLAGNTCGYLGELSAGGRRRFDLRAASTVAEIRLADWMARANIIPQYARPSQFPEITRDVNLVVDDRVRWDEVARLVAEAGGPLLAGCTYQDTYRDPHRLGAGRKSLLLTLTLRDESATLTSQAADKIRDAIVAHCQAKIGAELRGADSIAGGGKH